MRLWAAWIAKVEYLHIDLAGTSSTFTLAAFAPETINRTTGRICDVRPFQCGCMPVDLSSRDARQSYTAISGIAGSSGRKADLECRP